MPRCLLPLAPVHNPQTWSSRWDLAHVSYLKLIIWGQEYRWKLSFFVSLSSLLDISIFSLPRWPLLTTRTVKSSFWRRPFMWSSHWYSVISEQRVAIHVSLPLHVDLFHRAYKLADLNKGIYRLCLPLLFAMFMAPIFTYQYTFVEVSWCFSQFLGMFSDIPQIMLVVNPKNRTRGVVTYMALAAGYRAFYIPHWILKWDICSLQWSQ